MAIEIKELVIRATIDKKMSSDRDGTLSVVEKQKLKKEILAYCLNHIQSPINKKTNNPINR